MFRESFGFCRGPVHCTVGVHEPSRLLNFCVCLFFLALWQESSHSACSRKALASCIRVSWWRTKSSIDWELLWYIQQLCRQWLPEAICLLSSEETINFSHDSLNCNSKWHRFCYLFPWKTCLKWMMSECIADGCISISYQSCTLKMWCEISMVSLQTTSRRVARQYPKSSQLRPKTVHCCYEGRLYN